MSKKLRVPIGITAKDRPIDRDDEASAKMPFMQLAPFDLTKKKKKSGSCQVLNRVTAREILFLAWGRPIRKWKRICSSSRRTIVRLVFQCCEAKSHSKGFKLHGTVGDVLEQMEKRLFEIMMKKDSHSSYSKILKPIVGSEVIFMLINGQSTTDRPVLQGVGPVMNVLWDQATNEFYGKFSESVDTHVLLLVTTVNTKHICVDRLIETRDSEHIFLKAIMELGRGQRLEKTLLYIVGYNKNAESEGVKQDGELMNASEIGNFVYICVLRKP
ncbi:hypothetical protein F2Q70_00015780 [Brassica cretica]|uniref:Uncharacterized protein n=1 Tax=Brassica cretica TaxID=69181 RepID=A0A3N6QFW0_BRACR|nr:hypothetical protein F2Q70_00015780 [Brassica cretica]KAF2600935.1 hypothetical protein F2Q68_00008703 [Brassica cretica]